MRSHGNLICFPEDVAVFSRHFNGDLMATLAFLRSSMTFLRRSSWRLLALSLRSHGASTACIELHGARTACALRVDGTPTALTAFCLHSEVVEITSRVLISQVRHEPMLPVSDHALTVCLCPSILEHNAYYTLVSSSAFVCRTYV